MARLRMNDRGRLEITGGIDNSHAPDEVTSGEAIRIEVDGADELLPTRIEFAHAAGGGRYVSTDGYPLWDGMRAERAVRTKSGRLV